MMTAPYTRLVQYYEVDRMGVVHHANYIRWFEETRADYLGRVGFGYPEALAANVDFPVLSVSCEYKAAVRLGETVHIFMGVRSLDRLRATITYRVVDVGTGELRALGESTHCCFHAEKKRPVAFDRELPELYATLQDMAEDYERV